MLQSKEPGHQKCCQHINLTIMKRRTVKSLNEFINPWKLKSIPKESKHVTLQSTSPSIFHFQPLPRFSPFLKPLGFPNQSGEKKISSSISFTALHRFDLSQKHAFKRLCCASDSCSDLLLVEGRWFRGATRWRLAQFPFLSWCWVCEA